MLQMYIRDFEYDGQRLSDFGFIVGNVDGSAGTESINPGYDLTFNTVSTRYGQRWLSAGTQYDECLQSSIQICKDPCCADGLAITSTEYRNLVRWLNRKQFLPFRAINTSNNLLMDVYAPSLKKVNAPADRYLSDAANINTTGAFVGVFDLPDPKANYVYRITSTDGQRRMLCWYAGTHPPLHVGLTYRMSCYAKANSGNPNLRLFVNAVASQFFELTSEWKRYEYVFTVPVYDGTPPDQYMRVYFGLGESSGACELDMCGFRLEQVSDILWCDASFNMTKTMVDGRCYGVELTMQTNRPFCYGDTISQTLTFDEVNATATIDNQSDEFGYMYPTVVITCKQAGDLTLTNTFADCTTVIKGCSSGEKITMSGDTQIITTSKSSHKLSKNFNFEFLRLNRSYEQSANIISASLPCTVKITYNPIIKDVW